MNSSNLAARDINYDSTYSFSRFARKSQSSDQMSVPASTGDDPEIIIATIQRRRTPIGPNTQINELEKYLAYTAVPCQVITPFSNYKIVGFPLLAARRFIDLVNKPLGTWWFLRIRRLFLRLCLSRALRPDRPAVIYAKCLSSAQAALEARRSPNHKVVLAAHFNRSEAEEWCGMGNISEGDWVYRAIKDLESKLLPELDGLHFLSQFVRDHICERHPDVWRCKSIVLPNFLGDAGRVPRKKYKGDLISIGSLEPRKNQLYLLLVLHEARLLGHRYTLAVVGHGPDHRRLQRTAQELGVMDQMQFLGLQKGAARLLPMYRAYAHSALTENCPFVLIEAAAAGLPLLASRVGGITEILVDGAQGFYWPLDDPKEGARILIALLEDHTMYARCSEGARRHFESNYTSEVVARQLTNFLLDIGKA